ncbi:MAG: hypothetical protein AAF283_10625, partial [Cyanobacteria bacterium P01_A01_bin.70]
GDPFWQPLAIAIAGGIGGSPFLALYFTPAAYLMLRRRAPKGHDLDRAPASGEPETLSSAPSLGSG